jgi:hypothetical protein
MERPDKAYREINALLPDTQLALAQRHGHIRAGFMEALLSDERVTALFERWALLAATVLRDARKSPGHSGRALARRLAPEAKRFVTENLGLTWPWCALELFEVFLRMVLLGQRDPVTARRKLVANLFAPPVSLVSEAVAGESIAEAKARLTEAWWRAIEVLDQAAKPKIKAAPRAPSDSKRLELWGRWYYDATVRRPARSITSLARDYHQQQEHVRRFEDCDCRKGPRLAIRQAARLLDLAELVYPPGEISPPR